MLNSELGGAFLSRDYNQMLQLLIRRWNVGGVQWRALDRNTFLSCDKAVSSVSMEQEVFPQNSLSHSILNLGVLICRATKQNENEY